MLYTFRAIPVVDLDNRFWKDDGALAGTFGAIGVVILIAAIALFLKKRRRSKILETNAAPHTFVIPFSEVKEGRETGLLQRPSTRPVTDRSSLGERPEETVGISSQSETEPPSYSEVFARPVSSDSSNTPQGPDSIGQTVSDRKGSILQDNSPI